MDIITTIVLAIISELLVMLKEYKKIKLHIHRQLLLSNCESWSYQLFTSVHTPFNKIQRLTRL